ncbi:DUF72 domain-containing protein [Billgrantia kenyensis]|uniref:DUF72 domain-containing protein n=1 Tax=Billgrantia kenyensis TaxID=321266 RepID=A0A7V9VYJ7_9GAMM|nr:DUF72 domain-containing protein [Halomonas kenyensis]MBA2777823.1 DUF72 domain-containing protein [Halomonas kenyensis]MCG6661294.1 DUF72 domain-containing protein [Halomonas kenyensis]
MTGLSGVYLGLPMWANPEWCGSLYPPYGSQQGLLADYARVFSAVEGNTTFYSGAPKPETVAGWARLAPPDFRFCFKLPASLTHELRLEGIEAAFDAFVESLAPLHDRLGPLMVQLPRDFGYAELPRLEALLARWPVGLPCGVEVRHPEFFHKGMAEVALNRLLITHGANRILLDVRPLFSTSSVGSPALAHAQREKPKCPLHVLSTGDQPLVRFIGHLDEVINRHYFQPWIPQLRLWIKQGKTPFLFVHTADNRQAPQLARKLYQALADDSDLPALAAFPGECQVSLF